MTTSRYLVARGCYAAPAGDHNDCSVRSLAIAACVDYTVAFDTCSRVGRKQGCGLDCFRMTRAICELCPSFQESKPRITLARFIAANPRGHFVLYVRGHFFAVCDGIVFDWDKGVSSAGRQRGVKRIVLYSWRLV